PAPVRRPGRLGPRRPAGAEWRPRLQRLPPCPPRRGGGRRRAVPARAAAAVRPARRPPDPRHGPRRARKENPRMRPALPLLAAAAVGLPALAPAPGADGPAPAPDLPYQARRFSPVTHDVDFAAVVTAPYHTKKLRVWLPLPQTDAGQEVREKGLSAFPAEVRP